MPARTARVAGRAKRAYSPGASEPAQLSKSWTAWRAGLDLRPERGHGHGRQPLGQLLPQVGVAVHQGLDLGKGAGRPALDGVAGHGEGRAGEPDQRHARPRQFAADQTDRLGHVGRIRRRFERSEAVQVGLAAERLGHHRTAARLHVDAEADGVQGDDDVREHDGGVHAVAPNRLEGELGRQRGVADGGEDGPRPAGGPVLGQRAARLAHEPHGRAGHRLPQAGAHEVRAAVCRLTHPIGSMTTAVP